MYKQSDVEFTVNSSFKIKEPQWLSCWIPNPGVPCSIPLGGSKVNSAFHLCEVDEMSAKNLWKLSGKK